MKVETLGGEKPNVAVVAGVHGDEPCGVQAIERFVSEDHELLRPVKLVVANERAVERGVRYVETDMNRAIPGDPDSPLYEVRQAFQLVRETRNCVTLGIHSTVSYDQPVGAVSALDTVKREAIRSLGVRKVFDLSAVSGDRCVDLPNFVDIEAGEQGTDEAAEYAYQCMIRFLRYYGVLEGESQVTDPDCYRVFDLIEKEPGASYRCLSRNFERVGPEEAYATENGRPLRAEREFWPVLMSAEGHDELLGYRSSYVGPLSEL